MKSGAIIILAVVVASVVYAKYPTATCNKVAYMENGPGAPYASEDGWYSYCYKNSKNKWTLLPMRCPLSELGGFQVYTDDAGECADNTTTEASVDANAKLYYLYE